MPTSADTRLLELLDKWLASLELHMKYAVLSEDAYWKVQPWMKHQRPSKWILELAQQKAVGLRAEVQRRIGANDREFSDAMELMIFLANLVGAQHIERFIPLAEPQTGSTLAKAPEQAAGANNDATREMPVPVPKAAVKAPAARSAAPKISAAKAPARPAAKTATKSPARSAVKPAEPQSALSVAARDQVIADAVRLTQWGRKWYELAELISRMADRPSLPEVRRALKDHKGLIDKKLGR